MYDMNRPFTHGRIWQEEDIKKETNKEYVLVKKIFFNLIAFVGDVYSGS